MAGPDALKGKIVLRYFNLGSLAGRGAAVRNMLFVHGVVFDEIELAPDASWLEEKKRLIASGECPLGCVPVLYIDENPYYGHVPILRYLSAKFDAVSADVEVRYRSDVVIDEYTNWRNLWADALDDADKKKEYAEKRPEKYVLLEKLYGGRASESTPYFMAMEKPGFDDICVFTLLYDDQQSLGELDWTPYPTLKALYAKVSTIPRIAEWIKNAAALSAL